MKVRSIEPEIMDQPGLPEGELEEALRGLDRIHTLCSSEAILWKPIRNFAAQHNSVRVLDLACGSGKLSAGLCSRLHNLGAHPERVVLDRNRKMLDRIRREAEELPFPTVTMCMDLTREEPFPLQADVILCSYFCHHLANAEIATLLRHCFQACTGMTVILDLCRSYTGYLLATLGTRLLTRSPVVHHDGPRSVKSALSCEEFEVLIGESPWEEYDLSNISFERFLFVGHR